jgi:hypothetical protein
MRGMALSLMILVTPFHGCGVETLIFGADDVLSTDMRYFTSGSSAYFRAYGNSRAFSNPWAYMYVYSGNNSSTGRCIDAYVVDEPTSTVIKYYCR